jgi:hypothetical protein
MLSVLALCMALLWSSNLYAVEARRALLVGISDYEHIRDMDGPRNDVTAIRDVLVEHWDFAPGDVRLLVDRDATKVAIVNALSQLARESAAGDHLLVYFSGHGTSRLDPTSTWPLPHTTGALIPADFEPTGSLDHQVGQLLVGRWDLRPALERMDRSGVNVMVAVDACFSGNAVRGTGLAWGLQPRYVALEATNADGSALERRARETSRGRPVQREPYPYSRVVFLSAAAEFEYAADIGQSMLARFPTRDGRPHGAFSDGLARVLAGELEADGDADGVLSYSELLLSLGAFMRERGYPQTPQLLPAADTAPVSLAHAAVLGRQRPRATARSDSPEGALRLHLPASLTHLREQVSTIDDVVLVAEDADISLNTRGDVIELLDARGTPLDSVKRAHVDQLRGLLRREMWLKRFVGLAAKRNPSDLSVALKDHRDMRVLREGQAISLELESSSSQYVTLLVSGSDGSFNLLYPVEPSEVETLQPGQQILVPRPGSGDRITVTPPFGRNVVIALGSTGIPGGLMTFMQRTARSGALRDADLETFMKLTGQVQSVSTLVLRTAPAAGGLGASATRSR